MSLFRMLGFVAVGVALGFALGGVGPRTELAAANKELRDAKAELARRGRTNPLRDLFPAFAEREMRLAAPSDREASQGEARASVSEGDGDSTGTERSPARKDGVVVIGGRDGTRAVARGAKSASGANDGAATNAADPEKPEAKADRAERPRGFRRLDLGRFDELAAAQAMRIAASRAALIEQAGLSKEEVQKVDQTVKKMNDDLSGYGEEILQQASTEKPPEPAAALGLGHDVSGIMYEGQKQLDSIVGERKDAVDPDALGVWNYVDIERLRPAAERFLPKAPKPGGTESSAPPAPPDSTSPQPAEKRE